LELRRRSQTCRSHGPAPAVKGRSKYGGGEVRARSRLARRLAEFMDQESLSLLEFPDLLGILQGFAQSAPGRARLAELRPLGDLARMTHRLGLVEETTRYASSSGRPGFHHIEDLEAVFSYLGIQGQALEPRQFITVLDLLKTAQELKRSFTPAQWPRLAEHLHSVPVLTDAIRKIEHTLEPTGEVRESADPELGSARRRQSRYRDQVQGHLNSYFSGSRARLLISDPFVTSRNGRYVIPVKIEHQRELPGVVHGTSSSGATLFVEPLSAVNLNNQLLYYQDREQEVLHRILNRLTDALRPHLAELKETAEKIADLDALFAVGDFYLRYRCTIPGLNEERRLRLDDARHPLLEKDLGPDRVVAVSFRLDRAENVLVISGPNTGGKTVALKTLGLLCLMAQSGLPVPATHADLPVFRQVLADIGDRQSIAQHLSTFSAHILRIRSMMEKLDPPSLILLDELGTGTDPLDGSALGIGIIDFFRQRSTLVVATTHHQSIKQFAFSTPGVINASVELDPETLQPTYRLQMGVAGSSGGLEIASQLGMPRSVIGRARELFSEQDLQAERYLARLRRELEQVARLRGQLEEETRGAQQSAEQLRLEFLAREQERQKKQEKALAGWAADFSQEAERLVKNVKDRFEAARMRAELKRKEEGLKEAFRRKIVESRPAESPAKNPAETNIREGDWVYHSFFRKRGRVISVKNEEIALEVEGKRITASRSDLQIAEEKPVARKLPPNVILDVVEEGERELNLIGCTVEEAISRTDKFLDRAFVANLQEVRIIHGFGKGKLKAALTGFLSDHPHVLSCQVEGGATLVSIRP
jgi:DNA mismatch repair protein MutS2